MMGSGLMKDSPEKIRKILDLLYSQLGQGLAYFWCAESLHQAFAKSKLARSSHFLAVVYHASLRETVLAFARMVEQREHQSEVTIHWLLKYAENNPGLFSNTDHTEVRESAKRHRRQLQEHQTLIDSVLEQRDRTLAHLDKKHVNDPDALFSNPAGINLVEMERCFQVILEILGFYMGYYGSSVDFEFMKKAIEGDSSILLGLIEKHTGFGDWVRPPGQ
jgi:hypothetical protein